MRGETKHFQRGPNFSNINNYRIANLKSENLLFVIRTVWSIDQQIERKRLVHVSVHLTNTVLKNRPLRLETFEMEKSDHWTSKTCDKIGDDDSGIECSRQK